MSAARELRCRRDQAAIRFRIAKADGVELTAEELMRWLRRREEANQEWADLRAEITGVWEKAAKDIASRLVGKGHREIQDILATLCIAGLHRLVSGGRASKRPDKKGGLHD